MSYLLILTSVSVLHSFWLLIFLLIVGYIFLLLCMPGSFLLGTRRWIFLVGWCLFLNSYKYSWGFVYFVLRHSYMITVLSIWILILIFLRWPRAVIRVNYSEERHFEYLLNVPGIMRFSFLSFFSFFFFNGHTHNIGNSGIESEPQQTMLKLQQGWILQPTLPGQRSNLHLCSDPSHHSRILNPLDHSRNSSWGFLFWVVGESFSPSLCEGQALLSLFFSDSSFTSLE